MSDSTDPNVELNDAMRRATQRVSILKSPLKPTLPANDAEGRWGNNTIDAINLMKLALEADKRLRENYTNTIDNLKKVAIDSELQEQSRPASISSAHNTAVARSR